MEERELEGLKREMGKLAEHLEMLDIDVDSQCMAEILTNLIHGKTAESIIDAYGLIDEDGV